MSKTLIIAEKPSVARDIAAALKGFKKQDEWLESDTMLVSSGIGHLVTIHVPEAATSGNSLASLPVIPMQFQLQTIERTRSQYSLLKRLMARADVDTIVNACDAGREGELIFRLIYELAGCKKPMKRMWLQSMTPDAIIEAYRDMRPGSEFDALSDAAKCRSEADWLIGINGSRGVSRLHESLNGRYEMMSAGRVQTPTLAILAHRESEILNFVPQDYWEVHGTFKTAAGDYVGKWFNPKATAVKHTEDNMDEAMSAGYRINDKVQADAIMSKCRGVAPTSVKDQNKVSRKSAPKLFDLTTLQREANKKYKFSAQKTLDIAQALYEKHKSTSYPRTDASALPEDYVPKAQQVMATLKEPGYLPHATRVLANGWIKQDKKIFDNSKISDHFAIIPTGTAPGNMTSEEAKLYEMIVLRFIAVFHPDAEFSDTTRVTLVAGESFKTTGRVLLKQGWQEVYGKQASDSKSPSLCVVVPGESVAPKSMTLKTLQTKPPARLTEASLLSAMEGAGKLIDDEDLRDAMKARGLGTPATRAATIEGLLNTKGPKGSIKVPYVTREGKEQYLIPTSKGQNLIEFLDNNGIESLTSPRMTGEWEQKLLSMEQGKYSRSQFMTEIADMTRSIIAVMRSKAGNAAPAQLPDVQLDEACPNCGGILRGKGTMISCAKDCGFKLWRSIAGRNLSGEEVAQLLQTGQTAPLSGFISKVHKPFKAALKMSNIGKVEFVFEDRIVSDAPIGEPLKVKCPKCKGAVSFRGGDYPQYVCEKGDFKLWQKVASRALTDEEATQLIKDGELPKMGGFMSSKTNREFEAGLKLSKDKTKVEFVFAPR